MEKDRVYKYILRYLADRNCSDISYGRYEELDGYTTRVRICKSNFFDLDIYGEEESIPQVPLKQLDGIPILFGENKVEKRDGYIIVHADIVASTFFLITRYEEIVKRNKRDQHGRFLAKDSILYQANILDRPLVDEYRKLLFKYLKLMGREDTEPQHKFEKVTLTHDIDRPWEKISFKSAIRIMGYYIIKERKPVLWPLLNSCGCFILNPYDTFAWLFAIDGKIKKKFGIQSKIIYFVIAADKSDKLTLSYINDKKTQQLIERINESGAEVGIHLSYAVGNGQSKAIDEMELFEKKTGKRAKCNRNHVLCSREPEDMQKLIDVGITDDYTMGFADMAGFRLGTCRPVNFINPITFEVTDLVLHPMQIMDCTLSNSSYMGLTYEEALSYSKRIIRQVFNNNGELVLLWHNHIFAPKKNNWHKKIYENLVDFIVELQEGEKTGD